MLSVCSFTLFTHRPNFNLLADDLPTNDPGAGDEEEHEDRVPPKEDKDRKELGVGFELFLLTKHSSHLVIASEEPEGP